MPQIRCSSRLKLNSAPTAVSDCAHPISSPFLSSQRRAHTQRRASRNTAGAADSFNTPGSADRPEAAQQLARIPTVANEVPKSISPVSELGLAEDVRLTELEGNSFVYGSSFSGGEEDAFDIGEDYEEEEEDEEGGYDDLEGDWEEGSSITGDEFPMCVLSVSPPKIIMKPYFKNFALDSLTPHLSNKSAAG